MFFFGSFVVNIDVRKQGKVPYYPRPTFVLKKSIREEQIMISLQKYLGVGKLIYSRNEVSLVVRSLEEITSIILPHFEKYPVRGHKFLSYLIFKKVVLLMKNGKHLEVIGFLQILELSYFANNTTQRTQIILENITMKFGSLPEKMTIQSELENSTIHPIFPDYLVGLVDGAFAGSFHFGFKSNRRRIVANFTIVQGIEDKSVLEEFL